MIEHAFTGLGTLNITELIQQYGYLVLFIGTFLEGETVLVLAGFAAHRGYLDLQWVAAIAATAAFLGDQTFFWIGRSMGDRLARRFRAIEEARARVGLLVGRFDVPLIVGLRFLYGLRIAGPVALGMTNLSAFRFAVANAIGAILWAVLIAIGGYLFGHALEQLLGRAAGYEILAFGLIIVAGSAGWLLMRWKRRVCGRAKGEASTTN